MIARLPAIRAMGFDVLYFPPIHPIGTTNRKGRNNALRAEPDDVGSPYAIGGPEGGHDARAPAARHAGGLSRAGRRGKGARAGDCARLRRSMLAGPSVAARASGLVPLASGRIDALRRKPAQEIRGHRQSRFLRQGGDAGAVVGVARRDPVLGRSGRAHLPRRQSAHQAAAVLAVDDCRHPRPPSRRASSWPRRSPGRS